MIIMKKVKKKKMIRFLLKNKKLIFITGDRKSEVAYFIDFVFSRDFPVLYLNKTPNIYNIFSIIRSKIIILEDGKEENEKNIKDFLKKISSPVIIITETEKKARIKKIISSDVIKKSNLIIDFSVAKKLTRKKNITFGIDRKGADFYITDIYQKEEETNFKVNYKENTIPFWFKKRLKNKEIYSFLPAICVARFFNLNLVDFSYRIKEEFKFFDK